MFECRFWFSNQGIFSSPSYLIHHFKLGFLHGLTTGIPPPPRPTLLFGRVQLTSCMMDEAGCFFYFYFFKLLLQYSREREAATCILRCNMIPFPLPPFILPPPCPPSANQQAERMPLEPVHPASVSPMFRVSLFDPWGSA